MKFKATDSPIMGRIWALLTAVLVSYAGYDQYEKHTATTETTVNVNVEGIDTPEHAHGPVLNREQINAIIAAAVAAQHEKDLQLFKQKEAWD